MENENKEALRVEGNKTPRRTFSVSREFESILPEIDTMPNMSRFVCEAIFEKLQRTKNPNKDLEDALSHFVQIQSIIGRPMVSEHSPSQWTPPVQTQRAEHFPSSLQTTDSNVFKETEMETSASVQSVPNKPVEVEQEEQIQDDLPNEEIVSEVVETETETQQEQEKTSDIQENEDSLNMNEESIQNDDTASPIPQQQQEDTTKKVEVMSKARQTYLKSRASR